MKGLAAPARLRACAGTAHAITITYSLCCWHATAFGRLQAYLGPSKRWRWRYILLSSYADLVAEPGRVAVTDEDVSALRRIARDTKRPVLERFHAQLACGHVLWGLGKKEEAARMDRKTLEIAQSATPQHRRERVPVVDSGGSAFPRLVPVSECIDENVATLMANISGQDPTSSKPPPGRTRIPVQRPITWPVIGSTAAESAAQDTAKDNAMRCRSSACAHCGASNVKLSCCRKCKVAYYCSPACQRAGWGVHKPQCRAPGEHEAGDIVLLQTLQARPELNGQYFLIVGRDAQKPGRWVVENEYVEGGGMSLSVRQEAMQHVLTH